MRVKKVWQAKAEGKVRLINNSHTVVLHTTLRDDPGRSVDVHIPFSHIERYIRQLSRLQRQGEGKR